MDTIVITGATSGIGEATATQLAGKFQKLILIGRSTARAERIVSRINRDARSTAIFFAADFADLAQVRRAAEEIKDECKCIDVIIHNAGGRFETFAKTIDGFEQTFQVNHLAGFLLNQLLLERLLESRSGRILTISSGAHWSAKGNPKMDVSASNYDYRQAYAASKLANILFAYELADRLKTSSITSNAINPGGVLSRFALNNGVFSWMRHNVSHLMRRELRSAAAAAAEIAEIARSERWKMTSGAYISNGTLSRSSEQSYSKEAMVELWNESIALCHLPA